MKVGLVGAGAMGMNHARVCHSLGALAAVADGRREAREAAGARFGVPAHASVQELLRDPAVEAVVVATPTSSHVEVAAQALAAGRHVLVEKPLAGSSAEARRLVDQAGQAGLVLAVGHVERHNPIVRHARQALEAGRWGELLSVSARRVSNFPGRVQDVGCILDVGIHEIDLVRYFTGSEVESVHAVAGSHRAAPHEDHALLQMETASGVLATVEVNWLTPMRIRRSSLLCTGGSAELDYVEQRATWAWTALQQGAGPASSYPSPPVEHHGETVTLRRQEPLLNELEDFLAAAQASRRPLVGGEDGVAALQVAEAALQSIRERRAVRLG